MKISILFNIIIYFTDTIFKKIWCWHNDKENKGESTVSIKCIIYIQPFDL